MRAKAERTSVVGSSLLIILASALSARTSLARSPTGLLRWSDSRRKGAQVRRIFVVIAIVVSALGLLWLARLATRAAESTSAMEQPPGGPASGSGLVATTERPADRPSPTLGRIGGTLPETLVDPRLLAEKSRRTLTVFSAGRPVKTYRIALGTDPVRPKEREGDRRTPEGSYYVCLKNPESRYHLSLGLSYPAEVDAERGLAEKLITKREQRTIIDAVRHFRKPPWNTRLGGEIMIHGGGTQGDWTEGCLALSDADVTELYPLIPLGTEVEIRP